MATGGSAGGGNRRIRYIYDLPYFVLDRIACLLLSNDRWRDLGGTHMNFSITDIHHFERERNPSYSMIFEWGQQNHTVTEFFVILSKMRQYHAMSFLKDYVDPRYHQLLFEGEKSMCGTAKKPTEESDSMLACERNNVPKPPNPYKPSKPHRSPEQSTAYGTDFTALTSTNQTNQNADTSVDLNKLFEKKLNVDHRNLNQPDSAASLPPKLGPPLKQQSNAKRAEWSSPGACAMSSHLPRPPPPYAQAPQSLPMQSTHVDDSIEDNTRVPSPGAPTHHPDTELRHWHTPEQQLHRPNSYSSSKGMSSLNGDSILQPVPYEDIVEATNNFSDDKILGQGGFGIVYEGYWKKTKVAIKKIIKQTNPGLTSLEEAKMQQSYVELRTLNKYRIDNILPLYGYSEFNDGLCLIYQFMANGSLEDRLLRKNNTPALRWRQRLTIAKGSACGIHYLHNCDKQIIHGDIKSANILLDGNMEPKIGDFGLAREGPKSQNQSTVVSAVHGTQPYLPVDYIRDRRLSTKVDTYSFGIVLFELATGMRAYDSEKRKFLGELVLNCDVTKFESMKDKSAGVEFGEAFMEFINTGLRCVSRKKNDRPEMIQVLEWMENKLQFLDAKECAGLQTERRRDNTEDFGSDVSSNATDSMANESDVSLMSQTNRMPLESLSTRSSEGASANISNHAPNYGAVPYQNIPDLTVLGMKEPAH